MRCLSRNLTPFFYCLFDRKEPIFDENGNESSEYEVLYKHPRLAKGNISSSKGTSSVELFGTDLAYDRVLVMDKDLGIDENTVLFVEHEPAFDGNSPLFDYIVVRVSKSLNSVSYAIRQAR